VLFACVRGCGQGGQASGWGGKGGKGGKGSLGGGVEFLIFMIWRYDMVSYIKIQGGGKVKRKEGEEES